MDTIKLLSYAKINLTLEVSRLRPDGFHDIDSVVQVIDLRDELEITRADEGVMEVFVERGDAPSGMQNSVYSACEEFFSSTGIRGGVRCVLRKQIPAQAGLGGGSGNAAAAIAGLDRLCGTDLSIDEMAQLAAKVSSDAPLFLYGGTVRMRGRGELVEPLPDAPPMHLIVVKPEVGVSTAWAYAELDKRWRRESRHWSDSAESAIRSLNGLWLIESLTNDFDEVVSGGFEDISNAKKTLRKAGAEVALLCGSGSAVCGFFAREAAALAAADRLRDEFANVFVTRTLSRDESGLVALQ